jgi:hypothetical protein
MPMYDLKCIGNGCGHVMIDVLEPIRAETRECPECGSAMKRIWLTKFPAVHSDSIRGGVEIRHGICDENGKPVRYYSKSEMRRAAKEKGVQPRVEHIEDVANGSDKAPLVDGKRPTTRWV